MQVEYRNSSGSRCRGGRTQHAPPPSNPQAPKLSIFYFDILGAGNYEIAPPPPPFAKFLDPPLFYRITVGLISIFINLQIEFFNIKYMPIVYLVLDGNLAGVFRSIYRPTSLSHPVFVGVFDGAHTPRGRFVTRRRGAASFDPQRRTHLGIKSHCYGLYLY